MKKGIAGRKPDLLEINCGRVGHPSRTRRLRRRILSGHSLSIFRWPVTQGGAEDRAALRRQPREAYPTRGIEDLAKRDNEASQSLRGTGRGGPMASRHPPYGNHPGRHRLQQDGCRHRRVEGILRTREHRHTPHLQGQCQKRPGHDGGSRI